MFVFAHVGLTWGGAVALFELTHRLLASGSRLGASARRASSAAVDYRFLILGSVLPDLIDKPLGVYIFSDELSTGRTFAHSLLFALLFLVAAWAWRRRFGGALLAVALGSAAHLALDRLWMDPKTLLWPLGGWRPERHDVSGWPEQMLELLLSDPYTYVSEAVGALVVAALLASLLMRRGLREFALTGRMVHFSGAARPPRLAAGEEGPQQLKRGQRVAERKAGQRP